MYFKNSQDNFCWPSLKFLSEPWSCNEVQNVHLLLIAARSERCCMWSFFVLKSQQCLNKYYQINHHRAYVQVTVKPNIQIQQILMIYYEKLSLIYDKSPFCMTICEQFRIIYECFVLYR